MKNSEIAKIFLNIASILEIKKDNVFKIRAYERAAQNIEGLSESIENFAKTGTLRDIPGIGKDLEEKIKEYLETGKVKTYEELKKTVPEGVLELLKIPGIGPKTAELLFKKLKIRSVEELSLAIKNNKIKNITGVKDKSIQNILKGIEIVNKRKERMLLSEAMQIADEFIAPLKNVEHIEFIIPAGSLRRRKETVRDIDILVSSKKPQEVMDKFVKTPSVRQILAHGETKSSVRDKNGVQVDCRVVEKKSIGAASVYFTGSKDFNIKLRQIGIKKGLKVNEYGIFKADKYLAGSTEKEVFEELGMAYIEPELRENTGEIELAQENKLPKLIELSDIKGDLHAHSNWSDGGNSIEEMAQAAKDLGYSYIAITDHSQSLKIAGGLSLDKLKEKRKELDKINKKLSGIRVLYGTEADIDFNGNIDYKDDILKEFDIVVGAIHSGFKQSKEQITKRIVKACKNKFVNIIAHPTGRLWGSRNPYEIDFNEVFKVAKDTNTAMEINSFPDRLDLNDSNSRWAKEKGVKISIDTDSHEKEELKQMALGIYVARRGWLTKNDVLNTLPLEQLLMEIMK